MGFTHHKADQAECGGVYISANPIMPRLSAMEFIASTLNIGKKKSKCLLKKNKLKSNQEKKTIVTSLKACFHDVSGQCCTYQISLL